MIAIKRKKKQTKKKTIYTKLQPFVNIFVFLLLQFYLLLTRVSSFVYNRGAVLAKIVFKRTMRQLAEILRTDCNFAIYQKYESLHKFRILNFAKQKLNVLL